MGKLCRSENYRPASLPRKETAVRRGRSSPMRSRGPSAKIGEKRRRSMGGLRSRPVLVGLALAMVLGFAIYFRLWTIDYSLSSSDAEMLRSASLRNLYLLKLIRSLQLLSIRSHVNRTWKIVARLCSFAGQLNFYPKEMIFGARNWSYTKNQFYCPSYWVHMAILH